jgi:ribose/xylose/arabinose/galactoside ABC-type transport system permease subunit
MRLLFRRSFLTPPIKLSIEPQALVASVWKNGLIVSGLVSPGMFHFVQLLNILQVSAFLGVVATGQTLALLVGGIDGELSIKT